MAIRRRHKKPVRRPEKPTDPKLLAELADLYQRQLGGNDPAGREFLSKIGVRSRETIEAFKIGWSDGRLTDHVSDSQRQDLQRIGLLDRNKKETLGNSLIFPVSDPETGSVVDFHAVKASQRRKANLFDPPRGLLHHQVLKASKEIIITDWLEAALLIHQAGWRAVLPVRNAIDLKNSLRRIKDARLHRIWLCSPRSCSEYARLLKHTGAEIKRLTLGRDFRRIDADALKRQMGTAPSLQPARPKPVLKTTADDTATWEQHGCSFKVSGLDAEGQKVVVTASKDDISHADRLDLSSAASRRRFAKDASAKIALDASTVDTVLLDLLDEIQRLQQERRRKSSLEAPELPPAMLMPDDRKQAALAVLRNKSLAETILDDLKTLGLVGERDNALLLYLVAVSRKLQRPLSAILRSESASGKSNLVERILELVPEEETVYVSRLSGNALFYMPPDSLRHRCLVIEEREGGTESDYAVRILQSKGYLTTAIPMPPEEGSVMRTRLITVRGPVAYIETTTAADIDPQNLNRCFEVKLDESPAQTARIIQELHRRRASTSEKIARETILQRHHDMQRLLNPVSVLIPYAKHLTFPDSQVRFRRDHARLLGLVDASVLLHQYQREWRTTPRGEKLLMAELGDYELAHRLSVRALSLAIDELSANARLAWEAILKFKGQQFSRRQLMNELGWSHSKTYRALLELRSLDLLAHEDGTGQLPAMYQAVDASPIRPELGLLTPERLRDLLSIAVQKA